MFLNGSTAVAVLLSLLFIYLRRIGGADIGHPSSRVRTTVCLALCVFLAVIRRFDMKIVESALVRPIVWLGASSYSLYLSHPLVLPFVDSLCRKIGLDGNRYWITFWIQIVVAVIFGRVFFYLVERHFISSRQVKRLKEEHAV